MGLLGGGVGGFGPGRDVLAEQMAEHGVYPGNEHFPYTRPTQINWHHELDGWKSESTDPKSYEVVCGQCGDDGGPPDEQSAGTKDLRGPYRSERKAKRAAAKHQKSFAAG